MMGLTFTHGELIAHYDFTDGILTNNEVGPAETLTLIQEGEAVVTISPDGAAVFPGVDARGAQTYLQVQRDLGSPSFTVSLWFKTETVDQGGFQGIFSNNIINAPDNFSWQLDVHLGVLRLISATSGFPGITNAGVDEPQIQAGVWHHVVVRKPSSNSAELWFGSEDTELQLLGQVPVNPGGLQWFRLGINRNSDSLYAMEMANVKIYDDAQVSLLELNQEGPQLRDPTGGNTLSLEIKPSVAQSGQFDFSWPSQAGKVYDLVSASDLSESPENWAVWEGAEGISATPPSNALREITGGEEGRRFFAVIERTIEP